MAAGVGAQAHAPTWSSQGFKMASDGEGGKWTQKKERKPRRESEPIENGMEEEEEPNFSDSEDYVDDVTDEGNALLFCISILAFLPVATFHVYICPHFAGMLSNADSPC